MNFKEYLNTVIKNFEIVDGHDSNPNNGFLDKSGAQELFVRVVNSRGMTPAIDRNHNYMHDINNDGKYSLGEATLIKAGIWPDNYNGRELEDHILTKSDFNPSQRVNALFDKYDLNNDGRIDKFEVIAVDNKINEQMEKTTDVPQEEPKSSSQQETKSSAESHSNSNKLSVGAITGIILSCVFVVGVIIMIIIHLTTIKKKDGKVQESKDNKKNINNSPNPTYSLEPDQQAISQ